MALKFFLSQYEQKKIKITFKLFLAFLDEISKFVHSVPGQKKSVLTKMKKRGQIFCNGKPRLCLVMSTSLTVPGIRQGS